MNFIVTSYESVTDLYIDSDSQIVTMTITMSLIVTITMIFSVYVCRYKCDFECNFDCECVCVYNKYYIFECVLTLNFTESVS